MLQVILHALDVFARLLLEALDSVDLRDKHVVGLPVACPGTSAGRMRRQSDTVSSDPRTMSRSPAIRCSKSSASSGERS